MLRCRHHLEGEEEDMRTLRWLVVGVAAALLVQAGTAAAAPPDFTAAEKLCAAQGGIRFESSGGVYRCYFSGFGPGREELDEDKVRIARPLCESTYNGFLFASFIPGAYYECTSQA
jgi:hypothetical protein